MNNEMLLEIAKQHEEPIYAYDLDTVSSKLNTLLEVITWRPLRIYYAIAICHDRLMDYCQTMTYLFHFLLHE